MATRRRAKASDIRSHLGYRLRMVSNAVSHAFSAKIAAKGVTVAEWVILREMYSGDEALSPSGVADSTGLTRGAVSKLIDRLLAKKLVTRAESSKDRRYQEVKLTPAAIKLVPVLAGLADENDKFFFSTLSQSDRHRLVKILDKLSQFHELKASPTE